MSYDPKSQSVFSGSWEEITANHESKFRGHKVEVRILDAEGAPSFDQATFAMSMARVQQIMKDHPTVLPVMTAEQIYEDKPA